MSKRILITGSAGFVGSHWVEHLLNHTDWEIVGLDSFRHRGDAMRIAQGWDAKRYRVFACDLSSPISARMREQIGPVDYIVNMASESHVERSITDPVPFVQNNVNLALSVLEYARWAQDFWEDKPRAFVQISTDEVYGAAPRGVLHTEWSTALPSNPYAASKAAQEAIAISYWRTYGIPLVISNTMNMFGQRQDPEKFIPMVVKKVVAGEEVTIHGTQGAIGSRFYLHARNHADAHLFILRELAPTPYRDNFDKVVMPDRYNVVGEVEMDNLQVAKLIAKHLGKPLHYKLVDFHSARPGHDRRYALDGEKLRSMGWEIPVHFEESLKQTIDWTLKNPEWLN